MGKISLAAQEVARRHLKRKVDSGMYAPDLNAYNPAVYIVG
jgi:hypothetical protein